MTRLPLKDTPLGYLLDQYRPIPNNYFEVIIVGIHTVYMGDISIIRLTFECVCCGIKSKSFRASIDRSIEILEKEIQKHVWTLDHFSSYAYMKIGELM